MAGTAPMEGAFQAILDRYPKAVVAAVAGDAPARLCPLPDGVPRGEGHVGIDTASVLALVTPADQAQVARGWAQARGSGIGTGYVTLLTDPPSAGTLVFVDLRARFGVVGMVFVDGERIDPGDLPAAAGEGKQPFSARYSRMTKDGASTVTGVDDNLEPLLGYRPEDVVGRRTLEIIHPDDQETGIDAWMRLLEFPGSTRTVRLRHRHRDGHWVWIEVTNHNRLADPDHGCIVADLVDVSEEIAAHEAVRAHQQILEHLAETLSVGLLHADMDGRLIYANRRLTEITGLAAGSCLLDWSGVAGDHADAVRRALASAGAGSPSDGLVDMVDPQRGVRHCSLNLRPLRDAAGAVTGVTGAIEDVTENLRQRRELEMRAATDSLTGCLNRSATLATLQHSLDRLTGTDGDGMAVVFVDVDGLKEVNDRLGHMAGDCLLRAVASRLRGAVRARDAVGRIGGDEFVVMASHVSSAEHALSVARWVASRTVHTASVEGLPLDVRISLGVAWTESPGENADCLLRRADSAMYRSKREGRCEPVIA